jgi:hypothetical protein
MAFLGGQNGRANKYVFEFKSKVIFGIMTKQAKRLGSLMIEIPYMFTRILRDMYVFITTNFPSILSFCAYPQKVCLQTKCFDVCTLFLQSMNIVEYNNHKTNLVW